MNSRPPVWVRYSRFSSADLTASRVEVAGLYLDGVVSQTMFLIGTPTLTQIGRHRSRASPPLLRAMGAFDGG